MAAKNATKTTTENESFNFENTLEKVKATTQDVNKFALETTEDLVNEAIVRTEQWQNVATKAIEGGLKLATNQQNIVFDTLESLKGQLTHSRTRFSSLFSKN